MGMHLDGDQSESSNALALSYFEHCPDGNCVPDCGGVRHGDWSVFTHSPSGSAIARGVGRKVLPELQQVPDAPRVGEGCRFVGRLARPAFGIV